MENNISAETLIQIKNFPVLPSIVHNLQKMKISDDFSVPKIYEEIKKDPTILLEIEKIGCSPLYNLPKKNIKFIISFLGINEVFKIVFMLSAVNTIEVNNPAMLKEFWRHSYATALWTKFFSKEFNVFNLLHEDLWLAAMLHDIGKLVYFKLFPDEFKSVQKEKEKKQCLFSDVEKTSSSNLGYSLGIHWNLPNYVLNSCKNHSIEDLNEIQSRNVQEIVTIANLFAILQYEKLSLETKDKIFNALKLNLNYKIDEIADKLRENADIINQEVEKLL